MDTALGLVGMAAFIVCMITLAAGVTWAVAKLTPTKKPPVTTPPDAS